VIRLANQSEDHIILFTLIMEVPYSILYVPEQINYTFKYIHTLPYLIKEIFRRIFSRKFDVFAEQVLKLTSLTIYNANLQKRPLRQIRQYTV
jgi:hypothetical protein